MSEVTISEAGLEASMSPPEEQAGCGMALCLSGGGYRAMLFHAGVLWRLNDCGLLSRIDRVSSVSGGSIAAGYLWLKWQALGLDQNGAVSPCFREQYVDPLRQFAGVTVDIPAILWGLTRLRQGGDVVAAAYRRHLFGDKSLRDLPSTPRFVINAINMQSGALWRFSKPYCWDYRVGKIPDPNLPLATAVAASSAFPLLLSPMRLRFREDQYEPNSGTDLQRTPFTTRVLLGDGGIYDNLGLEPAKQCRTILVSDGGGKMLPSPRVFRLIGLQAFRVLSLIDNQVRNLRTRYFIDNLRRNVHDGAYWSIRANIADYGLPDALPCPFQATQRLAAAPTRLAKFAPLLQERLINWGYAVSDAAIRRYVDSSIEPAQAFPYPDSGVG
jgi:NTE family protein